MTVQKIIDQIIHRVGKKIIQDNGVQFVLDAMQRVYEYYNEEYLPIEKEWSIAAATFNDTTDPVTNYVAVPAGFIRPFWIDEHREFLDPALWDNKWNKRFTYMLDRLYFSGVDAYSSFDVKYYSSGSTLVISSPASGEVSTPEWPRRLHQLLLYATALELDTNYAQADMDMTKLIRLERRLAQVRLNRQAVSPEVPADGRLFKNPAGVNASDIDTDGNFDYGGTY